MSDEPTIDPETGEVLEGEAEEVEPKTIVMRPIQSPAHIPSRDVLMPGSAEDVIRGMKAYQELLPRLLTAEDYQDAGDGNRFVTKSGWRKIARAFNLSVEIIRIDVDRDENGNPVRAEAVVRATAPNGQISDGDGYCSIHERRFERPASRQKIENDMRATATTRAKNRAIADLVGMGEVSAEEHEGGARVAGAPADPEANAEEKKAASAALTLLIGDVDKARDAWGRMKAANGGRMTRSMANVLAITLAAYDPSEPDTIDLPPVVEQSAERLDTD